MCKNFQIRGKMSLRPFFYIWGMRLWAFFFWYTNNNICHAELVSASTQYIVMSSRTLRFFARTCYKEYFGISLVSLWIKWNCGHFSKKKGLQPFFMTKSHLLFIILLLQSKIMKFLHRGICLLLLLQWLLLLVRFPLLHK